MGDILKPVTVIQLSNGILFHSWVSGLPYFSLEPLTGNEEEAAAETVPPSVN